MLPSEYIKEHALAILSQPCLALIDNLYADSRLSYIQECAYVLATIKHETANTYLPIAENGKGEGKQYGKPDTTTDKIYYGRGYTQLTWKSNYNKFSQLLGVDLVNNPDLALAPAIAYNIIILGMVHGLFTGRSLPDYINDHICDYVNARRIINGTDKAQMIAVYASDFENLLNKVYPNAS